MNYDRKIARNADIGYSNFKSKKLNEEPEFPSVRKVSVIEQHLKDDDSESFEESYALSDKKMD